MKEDFKMMVNDGVTNTLYSLQEIKDNFPNIKIESEQSRKLVYAKESFIVNENKIIKPSHNIAKIIVITLEKDFSNVDFKNNRNNVKFKLIDDGTVKITSKKVKPNDRIYALYQYEADCEVITINTNDIP